MTNITRLHIENLQLAGNKEADNFREMLRSASVSEKTMDNALRFVYAEIPNTNYGGTCNAAERGYAQSAATGSGGVVLDASWHNYKVATSIIPGWNAEHKAAQEDVQKALREAGLGYIHTALRNAAMYAARFASWRALRGASLDAASDAALMLDYILAADLDFNGKKEHLEYVCVCWKTWAEGFVSLGGNLNGKPLVYGETLATMRTINDCVCTLRGG